MKRKEKRMILIIIIVGILIIGGILLLKGNRKDKETTGNEVTEKYVEVLEDGTKLNVSNKLKETKKLEGLEISNIELTHREGVSRVIGTVINNTNESKGLTPIVLTLYDDKGNELERLEGLIEPLEAGGSAEINIGVSKDYANAYDFKVERNK